MATIVTDTDTDMEAQATDAMVQKLMSRIYMVGHLLTPAQVDRIHQMLDDSEQPNAMDGRSVTEAAKAVRERIERDDR